MADSPELSALFDCIPSLRISAQANIISLIGELSAARIINMEKERALRSRKLGVDERAAELVDLVLLKVQEDRENFNKFMKILHKDKVQYWTVITKLERRYRLHCEELAAPTPRVMIGMSNMYLCLFDDRWHTFSGNF